MGSAHEVDYKIFGDDMQVVEIELDPNEGVVSEAGSMMYMDESISLDTIFGDGSGQDSGKGMMGKLLGAGKRVLTGESLFMTLFTNAGIGKQHVAFAGPHPGKIVPYDLSEYKGKLICQKDAFLCAAKGVAIGIEFQKKIGTALFGGEGFILQKLEGDGLAFVHAGGTIIERELQPGECVKVDTGCVVAFTQDVSYDIEYVGNIKSAVFGGEGFFYASLKGPGKVWLQSLPFSRFASKIASTAGMNSNKGEGTSLDLGGLFGND